VVDVFRLVGRAAVLAKANSLEDDGRVETKTIECNIKSKPRPSGAQQDFAVFPLAKMTSEVGPGMLGRSDLFVRKGLDFTLFALEPIGLSITIGLVKVVLNINRVSRRLGNGQSEIKRNDGGHATNSDNRAPRLVDCFEMVEWLGNNTVFEPNKGNNGDDAGRDCREKRLHFTLTISPSLGREHRSHHSPSNTSGRKLGGDDSRDRVISTDSYSHEESPKDDRSINRDA